MTRKLDWTDAEDIALLLIEQHQGVDPLTVRFTDLHEWVCALDPFSGDPKASSEARLEAIQMTWWEEYQDSR